MSKRPWKKADQEEPRIYVYTDKVGGFAVRIEGIDGRTRKYVDRTVDLPMGTRFREVIEFRDRLYEALKRGTLNQELSNRPQVIPAIRELQDQIVQQKSRNHDSETLKHRDYRSRSYLAVLGDLPADISSAQPFLDWWHARIGLVPSPQVESGAHLKGTRLNRELGYLTEVLDRAVHLGYRTGNPARALQREPSDGRKMPPALTVEQLQPMFEYWFALDKIHLKRGKYLGHFCFFWLLLALACRSNELTNVRIEDIDFDGKKLTFRKVKQVGRGQRITPPRTVPLSPHHIAVIETHLDNLRRKGHRVNRDPNGELLFPSARGEVGRAQDRTKNPFKWALEKA